LETQATPPRIMKLSDIKEFPGTYWCLNIINCTSTCSVFVVMSFGPAFLVERANYSPEKAGLMITLMNLTVLCAPLAGWVLDKIGYRPQVWILCCALLSLSFAVLGIEWGSPLIWLMIIGVAFAVLNSSVNASISLVVPKHTLGTAYGFVAFAFTTVLFILPVIVGYLREDTGSFGAGNDLLSAVNFVGFITGLLLYFFDYHDNQILANKLDVNLLQSKVLAEDG